MSPRNPNSARAHNVTDAQMLANLVRRHVDGLPLPDHVIERDGTETPLAKWLDGLRYDRTPFNTDLASRLDLQADPPLACEAAITLRARLAQEQQ